MTLQVKGDSFTISDARQAIRGTGTPFGPVWHWTHFKATHEATNGVRIEDENYMTDPAVLVARHGGFTNRPDRGRDGPKATPPSEPDGRFSRIRLSG